MDKLTLEEATLVLNSKLHKGDVVDSQSLYRLSRPSVKTDIWLVIPPPADIQVLIYREVNGKYKCVESRLFSKDELCVEPWEDNDMGWGFDIDWLKQEYQKLRLERDEIKSLIEPLTNFIGEDIKDYEGAIDSLLNTCNSLGIKDRLKFIKFLAVEYPKQ